MVLRPYSPTEPVGFTHGRLRADPAFSMLYVPGGAPRCRAHPPPRPKPCARSAALPRPPDPRPRAESRSKPHRSPTLPDLTRRRSAGGLRRSPDIETSRPADRATRHNPRRPHTQPLVISPSRKGNPFLIWTQPECSGSGSHRTAHRRATPRRGFACRNRQNEPRAPRRHSPCVRPLVVKVVGPAIIWFLKFDAFRPLCKKLHDEYWYEQFRGLCQSKST